MIRIRYKYRKLLFLLFLILTQLLVAQTNNSITFWGGSGYNRLNNQIENSSTVGGYAIQLGAGYQKSFNNFLIGTGLEFMYANSLTRLNAYRTSHDFLYDQSGVSHSIVYNYSLSGFSEKYALTYLNIPLHMGIKTGNFYALVGAKVGLNILSSYQSKGNLIITASDPRFIEEMENIGHGTLNQNVDGKGKANFGLNLAPTAEIGFYLDEWLPYSMVEINNKKRTTLSYRASIFADYGVLNLNRRNTTFTKLITEPLGYDLQAQHMADVSTHYLAGSELASDKSFNNLTVGLKLTVLMELPEKRVPPTVYPFVVHVFDAETDDNILTEVIVRYPTGRSIVFKDNTNTEGLVSNESLRRGRFALTVNEDGYEPYRKIFTHNKPDTIDVPLIPKPQFVIHTLDSESGENVHAVVSIHEVDGGLRLQLETNHETGLANTRLKPGNYIVSASTMGYINSIDSIVYNYGDSLQMFMSRIKLEEKYILENLFFDFDSAVIKDESEPTLADLVNFLTNNPEVKIHIVGHTDNIGKKEYNQRLSKRRAEAVANVLIERGIDKSRLSSDGKGMDEPIEDNVTEAGRAVNRRVEFTIL